MAEQNPRVTQLVVVDASRVDSRCDERVGLLIEALVSGADSGVAEDGSVDSGSGGEPSI